MPRNYGVQLTFYAEFNVTGGVQLIEGQFFCMIECDCAERSVQLAKEQMKQRLLGERSVHLVGIQVKPE